MSANTRTPRSRPPGLVERIVDGAILPMVGVAVAGPLVIAALWAGRGDLVFGFGMLWAARAMIRAIGAGAPEARPSDSEPVVHAFTGSMRSAPGSGAIAGMSDEEFDGLLDAVQRDGRNPGAVASALGQPPDDAEFELLVRDALDDLPEFVRAALEHNVVVLISDAGHELDAYGLYTGGTVANCGYAHSIHVFRDTLVGDFGCDREQLRRQVTITVRHEIAHHLGADERHVGDLGL